jgi:hypothetical protein
MVRIALVSVCLLLMSACATTGAHYFPEGTFEPIQADDHSDQAQIAQYLVAMHEPILCCKSRAAHRFIRLIWLRSFHQPVVLRLEEIKPHRWVLVTKMTSGAGGYKPGTLSLNRTEPVSESDALEVLGAAGSAFWTQPVRINPLDEAFGSDEVVITTDGATWLIEAGIEDRYKVAERQSPTEGPNWTIGKLLLALAKQDFGPVY